MNPAALSIRHPRVLAVAVVTVVVWGISALWSMPRQEDPTLTWRLANVVTRLPGNSADRVESEITDVLERFVEEVDEVEHIYSVSRPGLSLLQIELEDNVTIADPVWQQVRQKLDQAATELPRGVIGPELDDEIMGTFTALIAISSDTATYRQLEDYADSLESRLRYLPSIASTSVFGAQAEVVHVEVDPARLAAYELDFDSVAVALRNRNSREPSGRLRVKGNELVLETSGEFQNEHELTKMILLVTPSGYTVRLEDIAEIRRTTQDPPAPMARANGKPAIFVGVRARKNVRIDRVGKTILGVVDQFRHDLPRDVHCHVSHDEARYTSDRMNQLTWTMLLGVGLVFLSAAFFMGWKAGLVITTAIPLTGLLVLVLLRLLGASLEQMSVMGIIMAFGLLVDDAVVVTEHIHRKIATGAPPKNAAADGPSELFAPLVVTTLTTIAAFLPIYLLPGGTGEFVRSIPIAVTICLCSAMLVAMTVIPVLYVVLLRGNSQRHNTSPKTTAWFDRLLPRLASVLRFGVRRPVPSILVVVTVMAGLSLLGTTLRRDFFSPVQRDQFVIDIFGPQGSSLQKTAETVARIESVLRHDESIVHTSSFIGRNAPLVFYNLTSQETFANQFAQLVVRVHHWSDTERVAQRIQEQLNSDVVGASCCVHILEHGAPFVAPFELRIRGPSIAVLRELARRGARVMQDTPGVRNVRDNIGHDAPRLAAVVNEPVARHVGTHQQQVSEQLRHRFDGLTSGYLSEDDDQIEIQVRLPDDKRRSISNLKSVLFKPSPDAPFVPYSTVAEIRPEWQTASIYRRDRQRTVTVTGYPQFGLTPAQVSRRFTRRLDQALATVPGGYTAEFGGESEQRREAESYLLRNGVYALFIIVLLLMFEFRSFRLCALILIMVPLSMGGTTLGLWITGWPLNFMAIMGMMMLAGVVVNDAVILVDGFERRRAAGQSIDEIVIEGTLERARHVVITTITTIAGFLPLAFSSSLLWPPLAIAIIGGLSLATIITLVGIPLGYKLLRGGVGITD